MTQSRANRSTGSNSKAPRGRSNNVATTALLASLALILSYVEAIIPYTPGIPGIKLGIANLVAVVALYKLSAKHAVMLNAIRIVVAGLLFTGVFGMLYSLVGATISLVGMILLKKTELFSVTGVSMAGGFLHNIAQLLVAAAVLETTALFVYAPVLGIVGILTGILIGITARGILQKISR